MLSNARQELPARSLLAEASSSVSQLASLPAEELGGADFGKPGSRITVPFPPDVTAQVGLPPAAAVGCQFVICAALLCCVTVLPHARHPPMTG